MPVLEANGATLDYGDAGGDDKSVVVLLHGWLGSWDDEFGPEIEWLRPHYRVLALTRRGYGRSGPKPRHYTRDFYRRDAEDVAAWLDALNVKNAHILGYSDGGEVAILMPIIRPDLAKSVAAWGAVGSFTPDLRPIVQQRWPPTWITDDIRERNGAEYVDAMVLSWIKAMQAIIDTGGNVSLDEAHTIQCPLLMMLGRGDTLNPERLARALLDRTPHGRLEMFDCGHPVHREKTSAFRDTLWTFLQAAERDG